MDRVARGVVIPSVDGVEVLIPFVVNAAACEEWQRGMVDEGVAAGACGGGVIVQFVHAVVVVKSKCCARSRAEKTRSALQRRHEHFYTHTSLARPSASLPLSQ